MRGLPLVAAALLSGCQATCLTDADSCSVASPCAELVYECAAPRAHARRIRGGEVVVTGLAALSSPGDFVLDNGVVIAVIDAIEHPHYIAPTGGNLIDLATAAGDDDSLTHVFHAVGLLPEDTVVYERATLEEGDGYAAVQVRGSLAGQPRVRVATRYEIRACEPGIRVRTEIFNGAREPRVWALSDAWYWSGRATLPFVPAPGRGFTHPAVSATSARWEPFPFMAAAAHADPATAYFEVACSPPELAGFHTEQLSVAGRGPRIVQAGDFEVFERFVGVVPGRAVGPAADRAHAVREQLLGERTVRLRGGVEVEGELLDDEVRATVIVFEGGAETPPEERTPWTQVVPDAAGLFEARVPGGRRYTLELHAFGRVVRTHEVEVGDEDIDVGGLALEPAAHLEVAVELDGAPDWARVFVRPADDETRTTVSARLLGAFSECAPLIGSPTGGSPACARVLVEGSRTLRLPPGRYDVFAVAGLFSSVARQAVSLAAGETTSLTLSLQRIDLAPAGTLGADFHVHGSASFDSTLPDLDRVASCLAAHIDVIAATDHDLVTSYAEARAQLGADARLRILAGVETTGHILFDLIPGAPLPQVIGHWNAWPMPFDPLGPYRGAPWDELAEPGELFGRLAEAGWPEATGVLQLNHPWAAAQVGRDFGFPRAVGVDARIPLPRIDDGSRQSLLLRTPPGARFSNGAYHAQEVMNGTSNTSYLPYRAYWFYLLNQGILRAGTANSDSHTLVDNLLGTPRNLVFTDQTVARFDEAAFNRAVREGRMIGTNGPVIEAELLDGEGRRGPSVLPFAPAPGATLSIRVRAAPWVPIDQVRIIVNGELARAFEAELIDPSDPYGTDSEPRLEAQVALSELVPEGARDAWIVVEAGAVLARNGDVNCDGIPDTGDNDGDGIIDWRDVDRNGDRVIDALDREVLGGAAPTACDRDQKVGPLARPPVPARGDRGSVFRAVAPGSYPAAFTNPFVLDLDGDGFDGPGL